MTLWRIKLNSGRLEVDRDGAKAYCRRRGVVGVGWGRPDRLADDADLTEVLDAIAEVPDWTPSGPAIVRRLALEVADGDLIWTRDLTGNYWLGRIEGPYRYDGSEDAGIWDLNNIRPCQWLPTPLRDYDIPGAVVRNFAGVGQTLRRIKQPAAALVTSMLWDRATDPDAEWQPMAPEEVLNDLLDPTDVEDLVLLYLQADGWLLMPSSRMRDTPVYEAALRRRDGALAVVSVKTGNSAPVPTERLAAAARDGAAQAYAFSTHDQHTSPPETHGVTRITREQITAFMRSNPQLLPPRVTQWLTGTPITTTRRGTGQ